MPPCHSRYTGANAGVPTLGNLRNGSHGPLWVVKDFSYIDPHSSGVPLLCLRTLRSNHYPHVCRILRGKKESVHFRGADEILHRHDARLRVYDHWVDDRRRGVELPDEFHPGRAGMAPPDARRWHLPHRPCHHHVLPGLVHFDGPVHAQSVGVDVPLLPKRGLQ